MRNFFLFALINIGINSLALADAPSNTQLIFCNSITIPDSIQIQLFLQGSPRQTKYIGAAGDTIPAQSYSDMAIITKSASPGGTRTLKGYFKGDNTAISSPTDSISYKVDGSTAYVLRAPVVGFSADGATALILRVTVPDTLGSSATYSISSEGFDATTGTIVTKPVSTVGDLSCSAFAADDGQLFEAKSLLK